ncbi:MAG: DNA-3-methyladenine glycosylase family protein [Christensenellales bacterium]
MEFEEFDDYILVNKTPDFDVKQTLECGQVFRYKVRDFGYTVYSSDQKADIYCQEDHIKIFTNNKKYFINYFDFCTNYDKIKSSLKANPILSDAINYGNGIRILNSNPLEMIIEFIISQNNNIPRIKTIIERICEAYGEDKGDYYAFPTLDKLKEIPLEFFTNIKCGYRDKYLYSTIQMLDYNQIDRIKSLPTRDAREELMKFKGIGRKVADCILLFGFRKTDVFPTDTWVVKAYNQIYNKNESNAIKISNYFVDIFGELSGFAQQYLFYKMRDSKMGEKL